MIKKHPYCLELLSVLVCVSMHAQTTVGQATETAPMDSLTEMRQQIDSIDSQLIDLLARRMRVCQAVGEYKKRRGMAVVQTDRYHEILEKRSCQGASKGLDPSFVKSIMNLIHDESVALQEKQK